jgi:hypothetical protein
VPDGVQAEYGDKTHPNDCPARSISQLNHIKDELFGRLWQLLLVVCQR